jgi:long-chain fatty acid transport protein
VDYSGNVSFTGMGALQSFFPGGYGNTTIKLPSNLFVGIAYDFMPNLTVEADYQYVGWSSYDQLVLDIATGPAIPAGPLQGVILQKSPAPEVKDWTNASMARLGAEYRPDPFAIRAGFIYDWTPQPLAKIEPMLPDASRLEFTVGFGYKFTSFLALDFAYQIILFQSRSIAAPDNGFGGTYDTSANLFGLNLSYGI